MPLSSRAVVGCVFSLLFVVGTSRAATVTVGLDRWMYPFAFTGGTRDLAPTFGAVGSPGFDNRDGQFLVGFDTSSEVPIGQGAAQYQINSVTVRAMVGSPSGFEYDPTYDSFRTYLPDTDADFLSDADAGRPIELHGVGFRNGYTQLSFGADDSQPPGFEENTSFGAQGTGTRNVYPLGFMSGGTGTDISNNVDDRTESQPWAIGTTALAAGSVIPDNTTLEFALDIANDDVRNYLQQGLDAGVLGFAFTSMHAASQAGGLPTPQFVTKENTLAGSVPAVLEIEYQIIPEPATVALAALGAIIAAPFVGMRWRRRAGR